MDRLASSLGVGLREIVGLRMRLELRGFVRNVGARTNRRRRRVLLSGKRRACGSSGINIIPLPDDGNQFVIATSGPTPGGKVLITFDARARSRATMC